MTDAPNRPPGYLDTRCVICGAAIFAPAGALYPQCEACAGTVDPESEEPMEQDYTVVEQTEYRGAAVEIRRWEGSRCPLYRAHWFFDGQPQDYSTDCATMTHTMAIRDAERAIDRRLDNTTDHYSLADRLAEEEAGAAMADQDHDGLS